MPYPLEIRSSAFSYYPVLKRVKDYVDLNLNQDISLGRVAGIAGLEEKYFSAFFREKAGIGFRSWLTQLRVERAEEMIRDHDRRITDVAFSVGFRDLRTFERAFKRHTGMTPRSYKASVKP